mgnify:FL=1
MADIKAPGYDIPVKELPLGGGAVKILSGAPDPEVSVPEGEYVCVNLFGRGVRKGDSFTAPYISYEDLRGLFASAPVKSYSAKSAVFGYRGEKGRFLPLERVINELYGGGFSLAETAENTPDAVLTVSSGTRSVRVALGQLAEGERYYFPLLTSEQILAGLKPADARGEQLGAGLLLTESGKIVFVLGQLGWNDIVEPCFVDFSAGGALIKLSALTYERAKHNVLFTGPLGGEISAYPGKGGEGVNLSLPGGTLLRFNLDSDEMLNDFRMYYKFTFDGEECGTPTPTDAYVYNTRAALYFGSGADFPTGVILPDRSLHTSMHIKMVAHGMEYPDSELDVFNIEII